LLNSQGLMPCDAVVVGRSAHTDVAARAGPVVHDHRAQCSLHRFGQNARRHVDRATGREGHDDARGGDLRLAKPGQRHGGRSEGGAGDQFAAVQHVCLQFL